MSPSLRRFARHYAEMVVAMVAGMIVLGAPAGWALHAVGAGSAAEDPSPMLLTMAVTMTVPMVGWMRYRGHAWRATAEMSASMFLPTFAVIGLFAADLVTATGALMVIEHVAMLAGMLAAMLLRREEYACAGHGQPAPVTA